MKEEQAVITRRLNDDMAKDSLLAVEVLDAYARFKRGDWGDTCPEDAALNNEALKDGVSRIVAKYETSTEPIFIINSGEPYSTDENGDMIIKRITTLMYCEEYQGRAM